MPLCSVEGCTNKSGHLFPKNNPALKRKWLKFVGLTENDINAYSLICKAHFDEDAFEQHDPVPGLPPPRKRLRPNAVPTLGIVEPSITPRKTPLKSPKPAIVFDETVPTSSNSRKICLAEVDLSRSLVYSETQLARVIERIKDKLLRNAHPSSVFPKKWQNSHVFAGNPKIREGFPPFSMPCLVALAIEANLKRMATPSQIVGFIAQNFPSYKLTDTRWHGKVFETLETYKLFRKVPSALTDNPRKTFYRFVPNEKTILSSHVCQAFTDPFFDESKVDPSNSLIIINENDADSLSAVASEDIEESRVDEFDDDLLSIFSEDKVPAMSAADVSSEGTNENSYSNEREEYEVIGEPEDLNPDGSSSSDSVTFLECSYCEFVAASSRTISAHVLKKHWTGKNYCCTMCNYSTPTTENLVLHKATHKK